MQSALTERRGMWGRLPADLGWRWVPVVALLLLAAVTPFLPMVAADIVGPLGVMLGHAMAGSIIARKSQLYDGRERLAWLLVGRGFQLAAFGVVVVAVIGAINGSAPAFGPTDLIFVAAYLLILGGFASIPHIARTFAERVRVFLDGAIGAASLAIVLWATVLRDLLSQLEDAPFWERLIASIYPVLDVIMLIMLLWVAVRRSTYRFDLRLLVFGVALAVQASADMTFFVTGIGKTFDEASPSYGIYMLAAAGFLTAGLLLHNRPAPREYADRKSPLWAIIAPYSAAFALFALLATAEWSANASRRQGLFVGTAIVVVLVIGRQAMAIRENRLLVEQQREALVASISHELRTPLTSMVGFLELIEDDPTIDDQERAELVGIVRQQSSYMSRIVSDLILLARSDPSEIRLRPAIVEVGALVTEASLAADDEGGSLTIDVPNGLYAKLDADRIEQVLVNLLVNAVRYGGDRRLLIAIQSGNDLVFEVHDNGKGVPRKYELVIWERFERGPHRLDASLPGSGIGLSIVEAIAVAHGGHARYRTSERMGGACFAVTLPGCIVLDESESVAHVVGRLA